MNVCKWMAWIEAAARPQGWLDRHWIQPHRERCPRCAARMAAQQALEARLRRDPVVTPTAPPWLVRRIQTAVAAENQAAVSMTPAVWGRWHRAVAVAGLILAAWMGWRVSVGRVTPQSAVALAQQQAQWLVQGVSVVSPQRAWELAERAEEPLKAELQAILEDARQNATQIVRGCVPLDSIRLAGFWPDDSRQSADTVEAGPGRGW